MMNETKPVRRPAPELVFWGVRGSIARPGPETVLFGGNTACIEVRPAGEAARTTIIVDAGTGIVPLGQSRSWAPGERVDLLLSHLHHDHVGGLPFFAAAHTKGLDMHIWCGNLAGQSPETALRWLFAPPVFPLPFEYIGANFIFHGFVAGQTIEIGGRPVRTVPLYHPDSATGYRFDGSAGSAAILTDLEHRDGEPEPKLAEFCGGVDTIVYDMMIAGGDFERFRGWGHSTAEAGAALARAAGARCLVGFHHAPFDNDETMAERERLLQREFQGALMAREGMVLPCHRPGRHARAAVLADGEVE